ncbi:hypothetical protein QFC19_003012 [Naganishia cerealis]|uniref:Uncharacterized protein n=1 Tax=Naganishia cerealis TaxID=610337 RepID=A0ACC2W5H0_9TREE|nr:hypothetical protein QFC19_003012 [Naganishia cerealis]
MDIADTVINFYTYETTALNAPAPFADSTVNLRQEFDRIRHQQYDTDYDFNVDLFFTTNRLHDGHTLWLPRCYIDVFQNLLPIPIVSLENKAMEGVYSSAQEAIYVVPDADAFFDSFLNGSFSQYYKDRGFDIKRYAGAKVISIEGMDPYAYVRQIASNYTGDFLDDGIRQSMVYSSYRYVGGRWGQRIGDFAGPTVPTYPKYEIEVVLLPRGANASETLTVPYVSTLIGEDFTDQASYWENNCAANDLTNGVDYKEFMATLNRSNITNTSSSLDGISSILKGRMALGALPDLNARKQAIDLPPAYVPSTGNFSGSDSVTYFTMIPDTTVGVMVIGSFAPEDPAGWQQTVLDGLNGLSSRGADHLIIDVTNNGGGYVCDGLWLHRLLAGPSVDRNAGFEAAIRVNEFVQELVQADIELAKSYNFFENYLYPTQNLSINDVQDFFSKRHADSCTPFHVDKVPTEQPFDLSKVIIVGNGVCASTCSAFTTLMQQLHGVKMINFGVAKQAYSGMAGAEVLDWSALDSEFKTANLKDHPLAGPKTLLVNGKFRVNWRASYSYQKPDTFSPYSGDIADYSYPYTETTWNRPQAVWTFAAKEVLGV